MSTNPRALTAIFIPATGSEEELAAAAYLASLADPSVKGRVLNELARRKTGEVALPGGAQLVVASACEPGVHGIDYGDVFLRVGSLDSIENWINTMGGYFYVGLRRIASQIAERGGHAIAVANHDEVLGVVAVTGL